MKTKSVTPQFFCISDIGNSLSDCSQSMKKICIVEVFRANVLKLLFFKLKTALVLSLVDFTGTPNKMENFDWFSARSRFATRTALA